MEELKKSERPFYGLLKLFDQISDGIVLVQDGIIQYVNQKAVSMAESPPEEIIGKRFELFIASEDLEKVQNLYRARLSGENVPSRLELRLKAPSGKMTLVEAMADIVGYENQPTAVAILRDITERRRLEEQKKVLEIWNSRLLEKAPIPIVITDNQGSILEVNPAFTSLLGYENTEIKGKCLDQVVAKDEYLEEAKSFSLRSSSGQILSWESTRFRKDGQPISVRIVVIPIVAENKVLGKYVLYFDQTEKREAELKIKRNEERYRTIFECSRDAVFIANQRARFVEVNQAACELTGYTREELLRMSIPDLHEEIDLIAYKTYFKRILEGESVLSEAKMRRKDGTKVDVEFSNQRIFLDGLPYLHAIARDISEWKIDKESIRQALKEKEIMLKEIHHRVKNNLQIILSLIRLQKETTSDGETKKHLGELQNRIYSIALIHDHFYKMPELQKINLSKYLERLANHLQIVYVITEVNIGFNSEEIYLDLNTAIPFGLFLNELISLCFKELKCLPQNEENEGKSLQMSLQRLLIDSICFSLKTDFPLLTEEYPSFSWQIIEDLTKQLNASLEVNHDKGTEIKLTFKY